MNTPTPTPTSTPRTDSAWAKTFEDDENQCRAGNAASDMRDECAMLERELAALAAERDQLRAKAQRFQRLEAFTNTAAAELKGGLITFGGIAGLRAERDELRAECDNETKWAAHYLAEWIAVKGERDQLRDENATLRAAQKACEACDEPTAFEVRQLRARAEKAEAELVELHASFAGNVHAERNQLRAALTAEREKVRVLREALENLCDEQNGAPLCTREGEWKQAMDGAEAALAATEAKP